VHFDPALSVRELYSSDGLRSRVRLKHPSIGRISFQFKRTAQRVSN
jgi:hypothetical protein